MHDAICMKGTLLVALSLLTSAATAYAECAWVLWYRVTEYRTGGAVEGPRSAQRRHIPPLPPARLG